MSATLIDGNAIAASLLEELHSEAKTLVGRPPCIAFIRVGEDPASVSYVRKKDKTAAALGFTTRLELLPETVTAAELNERLDALNRDPDVDGILVQSPLPPHLDERATFARILPAKDVDGFHPVNLGLLCQEDETGFVACTPAGILELLHRSGISLRGKHLVVVGRSLIVGKPVSLLAMRKHPMGDATVTVCHSRTPDLASFTRQADILVAAIGRPHFITAGMVKPGAVVIDVGINRVEDPANKRGYRLVGDVDFAAVCPLASFITPVPGGVGPMTVALLMKNTLKARQQHSDS